MARVAHPSDSAAPWPALRAVAAERRLPAPPNGESEALAAQQAAVVELGRQALSRSDVGGLMADAVVAVAGGLGDGYVGVFELLPGREELALRAGAGWPDGLVGTARVPAGTGSHAGYTLLAGAPVTVADLPREDRFTPSSLLLGLGVVSGAGVVIGAGGARWGVLSAHSSTARAFTAGDVDFLQSVANVLALAVELRRQDGLVAAGRLAAGVAHDFNNVVTVINLCAHLLESQPGLDDAGREQLGHIRRETERAASLVWQVLDVAQRGPIRRVAVDLDRFFADILPVLRRTQPPAVPILFRTDGRAHAVMGDAGRLEQVMSNLATNALGAIATVGRIDVVVTRRDDGPAGVGPGPWVCIAFSDTGAGIPPEVLPRIFEPFFSTKPPGHGTGLGLAQVAGLVAQHDGHVRVSSTPGRGTTVTIWLPAAPAGASAAASAGP